MKIAAIVFLAGAVTLPAATESNPFLERGDRIPFDRMKAEHVVPAVEQGLVEAEKKRAAYLARKGPLTFENTIVALDEVDEDVGITLGIANHLQSVNSSPELRAGIDRVTPKVLAFNSGLTTDSRIYARVKESPPHPRHAR